MRVKALLMCILMSSFSLSGCFGNDDPSEVVDDPSGPEGIFVTGADGMPVDVEPLSMNFSFSDIGEDAPEPSIGVTSTGCVFFIALEKVMRSCDYGESWEDVAGPMCAFQTNDPWGWVDPVTDRIFAVQMQGLETSWICWSDDDGESWLGNPH